MTPEKRETKIAEKIEKEKSSIEKSKAKIRILSDELKRIDSEKMRAYADEFLKILVQNGFESESDKREFLREISESAKEKARKKSAEIQKFETEKSAGTEKNSAAAISESAKKNSENEEN